MRAIPRVKLLATLCAAALLAAAVPAPPDSPVADAAKDGDVEAVRTLLRQGADVNASHGDGMTALHWAARNGDLDIAEMLLYAGGRVGSRTRNGHYTPLHLAARAGHAPVVDALLAAGSDPDAATTTGATPLHFAAAAGSAAAIRGLLDHGAAIDAPESAWNQTPLMWAAAYDQLDAVEVLLARGAALSLASRVVHVPEREEADRDARRRRAERIAALREIEERAAASDEEAAEAEEGDEETAEEGDEETAEEGGEETAEEGDEAGDEADEESGEEPAEDEEKDYAEADEQQDAQDEQAGDEEKASDERADEDAEEEEDEDEPEPLSYGELVGKHGGLTPLLFAVRQGNAEVVRELLDAGADVDQVSAGDHTSPLLLATINGQWDLAMELLERGADPTLASDAGATPLYAAINLQWGPKSWYPQPTAYKQQRTEYLELMRALLEAGADPNVRLEKHLWYMSFNFDVLDVDTWGATPFWRAAYAADVEAMKLLVSYGADPTIPTRKPPERRRRSYDEDEEEEEDPSGLPPVPAGGPAVYAIHAASGVGYGEGYAANSHRHAPDGWLPAVKYLVEELGADVNARDHNGYNAIHHAAARGDDELIRYLVEQGGEVTAVSREGQTTADMANGPVQRLPPYPETIELLETLGSENNHNCMSC